MDFKKTEQSFNTLFSEIRATDFTNFKKDDIQEIIDELDDLDNLVKEMQQEVITAEEVE